MTKIEEREEGAGMLHQDSEGIGGSPRLLSGARRGGGGEEAAHGVAGGGAIWGRAPTVARDMVLCFH